MATNVWQMQLWKLSTLFMHIMAIIVSLNSARRKVYSIWCKIFKDLHNNKIWVDIISSPIQLLITSLYISGLGVCTLDFSTVNQYKRSATYYIFGTTLILPCVITAICGLVVLINHYSGSLPDHIPYFKIIYFGSLLNLYNIYCDDLDIIHFRVRPFVIHLYIFLYSITGRVTFPFLRFLTCWPSIH
jgi:hypothetical protein